MTTKVVSLEKGVWRMSRRNLTADTVDEFLETLRAPAAARFFHLDAFDRGLLDEEWVKVEDTIPNPDAFYQATKHLSSVPVIGWAIRPPFIGSKAFVDPQVWGNELKVTAGFINPEGKTLLTTKKQRFEHYVNCPTYLPVLVVESATRRSLYQVTTFNGKVIHRDPSVVVGNTLTGTADIVTDTFPFSAESVEWTLNA